MDFKKFYLHPEYAKQGENVRKYWRTWLGAYEHIIHPDGSIDIIRQRKSHGDYRNLPQNYKGEISFNSERDVKYIPFKFKKVHINFDISYSGITSLEGCPEVVLGSFMCAGIKLNNLKDAPLVGESFICNGCDLTSLEGCPEIVPYIFNCESNKITSLENSPKETHVVYCVGNQNLKTLKGAPEIFKKDPNHLNTPLEFNFRNCRNLEDLNGLPYAQGLEYKYDASKFTKEELEKAKNASRIYSHLDQEEKDVFEGIF